MSKIDSEGYDFGIGVGSLKSLGKITFSDFSIDSIGWKIFFSSKKYENMFRKSEVLGIIGGPRRGKTFILERIMKMKMGHNTSDVKKGIYLKFSEEKCKSIIALDSFGSQLSLKNILPDGFDSDFYDYERTEAKNEIVKDKLMTDKFIQNFIIHCSNIVIAVVNSLTSQEQKFLNESKNKCKKEKKLFVIHNLSSFVEKRQVEDYIENVLLKSLTFKLRENKMVFSESTPDSLEEQNRIFFTELPDYNGGCEVVHFLMAREGSNAGKYFNKTTLNFIRSQAEIEVNREEFDVVQKIKEYFIKFSKKYTGQCLTEDSIVGNVDDENQIIKLKDKYEEITFLDNCLDEDEMNVEEISREYIDLKYCYYHKKDEYGTWFVVVLEIPEKIAKIKSEVFANKDHYSFKISGIKMPLEGVKMPLEGVNGCYEFETKSNIQYGKFSVQFDVKYINLKLKTLKVVKKIRDLGYLALYYEIKT